MHGYNTAELPENPGLRRRASVYGFKVCKSVHHRTIQINHQLDATVSPVYYPDVYLQLNMFRASSRPSSEDQQLQQQPLVLPSYRSDSRAVVRDQADHEQQHGYHQDMKVKPEATTAVVELLMMGVGTPETC